MIRSVTLGTEKQFQIGKIVCVGRNYAEHARELGGEAPDFPILFLKPPSALIFDGGEVIYPSFTTNLHHEVELVLLIGKDVNNGTIPENAKAAIAGYAVGLDMTARDLQRQAMEEGNPWTVAKGFDTSAALSSFVPASEVPDILAREITLKVNGEFRQKDKLNLMIFPPEVLVANIASRMKLEAGDLIYTGTPKGVSPVKKGDLLEAAIQGVWKLSVKIV
jgi:5-carboxymethyl-2-hydroxymuconate isomerase